MSQLVLGESWKVSILARVNLDVSGKTPYVAIDLIPCNLNFNKDLLIFLFSSRKTKEKLCSKECNNAK